MLTIKEIWQKTGQFCQAQIKETFDEMPLFPNIKGYSDLNDPYLHIPYANLESLINVVTYLTDHWDQFKHQSLYQNIDHWLPQCYQIIAHGEQSYISTDDAPDAVLAQLK